MRNPDLIKTPARHCVPRIRFWVALSDRFTSIRL